MWFVAKYERCKEFVSICCELKALPIYLLMLHMPMCKPAISVSLTYCLKKRRRWVFPFMSVHMTIINQYSVSSGIKIPYSY